MKRGILTTLCIASGILLSSCSPVNYSSATPLPPTNTLTPNPTATVFAKFTQTAVQAATNLVNTRVAANAYATAKALTPTSTPLPPTPTTDFATLAGVWRTYRNETYGFTIEYPAAYDEAPYEDSCSIRENGNGVHLGARSNLLIFDSHGMSLEEYTDQILGSRDWKVETRKTEMVNGFSAITIEYRFGSLNRYGTFTLIKRDESIFAFDFTAGAFCDIPESKVYEFDAYHHMIASFQFTK